MLNASARFSYVLAATNAIDNCLSGKTDFHETKTK